jgi:GT2 family glycosyltransferase
MNSVTVIIVNYNGAACIGHCIERLMNQTYSSFKAIIVDNGSTDNSPEALKDLDDRFTLIALKENTGFAAANNVAIRQADTTWVATLNPDAFPDDDWLARLMDGALRYPGVTMFGSVQLQHRDPGLLDGLGDVYSGFGFFWRGAIDRPTLDLEADGEIFSPCAAAALYRLNALREVNGFDENFFCYCEDVDLGFRLRLNGHKCMLIKDAVVRHMGSETVGRYGDFAVYHGFRNRIWTLVKNYPGTLFFLALPVNILATLALSFLKYGLSAPNPALRGIIDGLKEFKPLWKQRQKIQRSRTVESWPIYRAMSWSLLKLIRRLPDIRPISSVHTD